MRVALEPSTRTLLFFIIAFLSLVLDVVVHSFLQLFEIALSRNGDSLDCVVCGTLSQSSDVSRQRSMPRSLANWSISPIHFKSAAVSTWNGCGGLHEEYDCVV